EDTSHLRGDARNCLYFLWKSFGFPPRNLWTYEMRGGIFVEDNDDVLEGREVSLR
ncbi:hypothetical protein A2U01_0025111, partial [Trifolium medium]|nr:hypothetical protein [Trifolium medium]